SCFRASSAVAARDIEEIVAITHLEVSSWSLSTSISSPSSLVLVTPFTTAEIFSIAFGSSFLNSLIVFLKLLIGLAVPTGRPLGFPLLPFFQVEDFFAVINTSLNLKEEKPTLLNSC